MKLVALKYSDAAHNKSHNLALRELRADSSYGASLAFELTARLLKETTDTDGSVVSWQKLWFGVGLYEYELQPTAGGKFRLRQWTYKGAPKAGLMYEATLAWGDKFIFPVESAPTETVAHVIRKLMLEAYEVVDRRRVNRFQLIGIGGDTAPTVDAAMAEYETWCDYQTSILQGGS